MNVNWDSARDFDPYYISPEDEQRQWREQVQGTEQDEDQFWQWCGEVAAEHGDDHEAQ